MPHTEAVRRLLEARVAKPPNLCTAQTIIQIIITNALIATNFWVHKEFLTFYSPYFAKALNGPRYTQSIILENCDVEAFAIVTNWIYTQKLHDKDYLNLNLELLAKVWILAQRFSMKGLKEKVVGFLIKEIGKENYEGYDRLIKLAYEHSDGPNPLKEIVVWGVLYGREELLRAIEEEDGMPAQMQWDVMREMKNYIGSERIDYLDSVELCGREA